LVFVDRCFPILGLALTQRQGKHITSIWPPLVKKKLHPWIGELKIPNATSSISSFRFLDKQFVCSGLRLQSRESARFG
jgi:hypothetical protein